MTTTLTEILAKQSAGIIERIDLNEHMTWATGLDSIEYWNLFQAWGLYAGSSDPNVRRTQTYEIEGWLIDNLFITPEQDWWIIKQFLRDYYEYLDCPMRDADINEIMSMTGTQRNMILGAFLDLAVNLYQTLRSSDMSNERIRGLFTVIARDWLDWWSKSNEGLEVLDIDEHKIDYSEFAEAARLLRTLFSEAEEDETDDIDDDEAQKGDLEE